MSEIDINIVINGYLKSALDNFVGQNYNDAIRNLKAAEVLDKENPVILYNLGIIYSKMGLFKTAIPYFERLLNLKLSFIDTLSVKKLLALAYIKTKNYSHSVSLLEEIQKLDEDDIQVMNMLGYCFEKQNNLSEAIKIYSSVISEDKECFTAYNALAYTMAKGNKDLKKALQLIKKALEKDEENPAYLDTAGYIYMKLGNNKEAEILLKKALEKLPFNDEIKEHLGELGKL